MSKTTTLEDFMKKYLGNQARASGADSYDLYRHKNGIDIASDYSDKADGIYSKYMKGLATYGANNRKIANKGLQNSGYASYISSRSLSNLGSSLDSLSSKKAKSEAAALGGYASYLDSYLRSERSTRSSVISYLVNNDVADRDSAIAYGISRGLSESAAREAAESAYSVTIQRIQNDVLEHAVSLGLDKEGAVLLAKKLGASDEDADRIGGEVEEMLKHYRNISDEYLEYLEEKSKGK